MNITLFDKKIQYIKENFEKLISSQAIEVSKVLNYKDKISGIYLFSE